MACRGGATYRRNKEYIFSLNLEKYGEYTCEACKLSPLYKNKSGETKHRDDLLTADHIQPLSKGGSNSSKNLQVLCGKCNCIIKGSNEQIHEKIS